MLFQVDELSINFGKFKLSLLDSLLNVSNAMRYPAARLLVERELSNLCVIPRELPAKLNLVCLNLFSALLCSYHRLANDFVSEPSVSGNVSNLINDRSFDFTRWQRRMLARLSTAFDRSDACVIAVDDRVSLRHVVNHRNVAVGATNQPFQ